MILYGDFFPKATQTDWRLVDYWYKYILFCLNVTTYLHVKKLLHFGLRVFNLICNLLFRLYSDGPFLLVAVEILLPTENHQPQEDEQTFITLLCTKSYTHLSIM